MFMYMLFVHDIVFCIEWQDLEGCLTLTVPCLSDCTHFTHLVQMHGQFVAKATVASIAVSKLHLKSLSTVYSVIAINTHGLRILVYIEKFTHSVKHAQ